MGFINEYVSEEDIKKYNLDNLWNEIVFKNSKARMPDYRNDGIFKYSWTINKTKECWLIYVRNIPIYIEFADKFGDGSKREFMFYWNKGLYIVTLNLSKESTVSIFDKPYNTFWELVSLVDFNNNKILNNKEAIDLLRKAVSTYGRNGISKNRVENNFVELKVE